MDHSGFRQQLIPHSIRGRHDAMNIKAHLSTLAKVGGLEAFFSDRGGLVGDYLPDINNRRARSMVLQGREDI